MIGVLALTMGQAFAQRCLPKMQGIEVNAGFVDGKPMSAAFCGGAALSTYTKNGSKWVFGGEYLQREYGYSDMTIPVAQFTAEGGYYQKLLTDGSKTLFVYGGASVLAGYESVNWGKTKHTLQLGLDIENLLNFLCKDWGAYKEVLGNDLLSYNVKTGQYQYNLVNGARHLSTSQNYEDPASTYRIQFTIRYLFN